MTRHRRRSIALAAVAAALVIASVMRGGHTSRSADPLVQIVSVRRPLAAGVRITASDLAVRAVPSRWADPHQMTDPGAAVGRRSAVPLSAGAPLMDAELAAGEVSSLRSRDLAVRLDDVAGLPADDLAGTTADLYLVVPGRPPRIRLVIEGVQVVGSSATDGVMVATLRVSSRDVAALIEAESSGSLRLAGRPLR
jgi:Flp pilus assembly protein CpaB